MLNGLRPHHVVVAACLLAAPVAAQAPQTEKVDFDAIYKIKEEGLQHSQVMDTASWLTDVYGGRLTGSPNIKAAGDWTVKKLTEWGAQNARLETWGEFGTGWQNERFSATVLTPVPWTIIGAPKAWTPGTDGVVTADAVYAPMTTDQDLERWKGKLKGKIVLTQAMREVQALWSPPAQRYTAEQLLAIEAETDSAGRGGRGGRAGGPGGGRGQAQTFARTRMQFFKDEGVVALVTAGRGDGGTVFVQGGQGVGSREANADLGLPSVTIAIEHYGRIVRTLEKQQPVKIDLEIKNTFSDDTMSFNVVGEIPGTDKADEVVMLGAHFDSWHGGTGATDNAAGSAVMMEVMRILKQSGVRLRRTVRIGLWGGEEQGLLGSRAYVTNHFANRADMVLKPEHAKFSSYYNVDNGTGAIRGIYTQGNEAVSGIFEAWMKPFRNIGMTTITIRDTGGTDHQSFDAVGLPGFQFIQDPVEYDSRTHHSNMDVYERIQAADMKQNAVIVAAFVYHAATRDEKLPRKPLPKPQGSGRGTQ